MLGVGAERLQAACKASEAVACTMLGSLHMEGRGVKKDLTRAMGLFHRACGQGDGGGCYNLGQGHRQGLIGNRTFAGRLNSTRRPVREALPRAAGG